jgi:hypothetical protein
MHEIIRSGIESEPFSLAMETRRRTISFIPADDGSKTKEREVYEGVLRTTGTENMGENCRDYGWHRRVVCWE